MNKLGMLDAWKEESTFFTRRSAQSYFGTNPVAMASNGSCGSSCGTGDPDPKPTACGSGCGAGDK